MSLPKPYHEKAIYQFTCVLCLVLMLLLYRVYRAGDDGDKRLAELSGELLDENRGLREEAQNLRIIKADVLLELETCQTKVKVLSRPKETTKD